MGSHLSVRDVVVIGILYAVLVIIMTWPAPRYLSSRLIGNNIDNWIFYWNNWHVKQAILNGTSLFETKAIFFPAGVSLVAHSHSILNSLLAFVIEWAVGPVAAFNLQFLFNLWVGALGMFLFMRQLTQSWLAAFVSGFVFAFAPYHLTQLLAHTHLGSIHWWPFFALVLHQLLAQPRWRYALGASVFAALTLWSGLQLAVLLGIWTLFYLVWYFVSERANGRFQQQGRYLLITGVLTLLLTGPMIGVVVRNWTAVQAASQGFDESAINQTDLLSYWVPPTYHPLWGDQSQPIYEKFRANRTAMPYLGFSVVGLAIIALWRHWKQTRFWLFSGLMWVILAIGPSLRFNGQVFTRIQFPFAWIGGIFPLSAIRTPDRLNLLLVFSLAVLAGWGTAVLARKRAWLVWLVLPLVFVEYLTMPLPMWELPPMSPFIQDLAGQPTTGIVDYPMGYTQSKLWLYYQTIHGQPTIEGHVSRYTDETYTFIAQQPLLSALYASAAEKPSLLPANYFPTVEPPLSELGPAVRALQAANVHTLIVHTTYASEAELRHWEQVLPFVPIYQDATISVYDLDQPRSWQIGDTAVSLNDPIKLVWSMASLPENSLLVEMLAALEGEDGRSTPCTIHLTDLPPTAFTLFPDPANWQSGDLTQRQITLNLPDTLRPGSYDVLIACDEHEAHALPDKLVVTAAGERLLLRDQLNISYQSEINLIGYRWWTKGAKLHVELPWQALQDISGEYKVFVHLLNAAGQIVRQVDAVPCQWTCPTSQWQADDLLLDETVLDLWGLPSGNYQLAVGLYDAVTGERLTAQQSDGTVPDSYLKLPEPITIFDEDGRSMNNPAYD